MKKIFILLLIILTCKAAAQNDTARTFRTTHDLGVGINLSGGNNSLYGGTFRYNYTRERKVWTHGLMSSLALNWVTVNDNTTISRRELDILGFASTNRDRVLRLLTFAEVQHSLARLINKRWGVGIGPSYRIPFKHGSISCSECLVLESTDRFGKYSSDYTVYRASSRIHFVYLTDFGTFTTITMFQPAIYNPGGGNLNDFLVIRSSNKFDFVSTKNSTLGITADLNYEKFSQFINLKKLDWGTIITFTYKITK